MNDIVTAWMLVGILAEIGCLAFASIVKKENIMHARELFEFTVLSLIGGPLVIIAFIMYIREQKSD